MYGTTAIGAAQRFAAPSSSSAFDWTKLSADAAPTVMHRLQRIAAKLRR